MDVNSFVIGYTKGKQSASGGGSMEGFHKVQFFNDDRTTLLYTVFVPTGASAIYAGETPVSTIGTPLFIGFEPLAKNVTADLDCYAVYELEITTLNETSWKTISMLSANGMAENYFSVGDTKTVHISGIVGTLEVNENFNVYIIGFDHNREIEGNGIHFGTFKSAEEGGRSLGLVDSKYYSSGQDGSKTFSLTHWHRTNACGWIGCDMRYDILGSTDKAPGEYGSSSARPNVGYDPSATCATAPVANTLMAALPADLRAVMKPMTKYTNNSYKYPATDENITATIDYLPLLSEFEVFGNIKTGNSYEQYKQKQYDYYAAGSSIVKYQHSNTTAYANWWIRSNCQNNNYSFCLVNSQYKYCGHESSNYSFGLAPIFKV